MINDRIAKWVGTLRNHQYSPAEDLPASRKAVFMSVLAYANWQSHECYPGLPRLAKETGYSKRTVQAALHDLERWGFLKKTRSGCRGDGKGRGRLANEYLVHVPEELLPAQYRTKRQPSPESQLGLNGNHGGVTGNEQRDQPATIATQDNHRKLSIKQDNGRVASDDADASLSFREEVVRELEKIGIRGTHAQKVISEHGLVNVGKRLGIVQQWKPTIDQAPGAFEAAGRCLEGKARLRLPSDDNQLVDFARKHGLPEANPGEEYVQYRSRLNAELQKRQRTQ